MARRDIIAVPIDHSGMITGADLAHAAGALLRRGAANDEVSLGRAVAVDQPDAGALLEGDMKVSRHSGAKSAAHAMAAFFGRRLPCKQDRNHRAEDIRSGGAVFNQGLPEP